MKTRQLVADAMLIAMYVVLSNFVAINLGGIRITVDVLPVFLAALLFGPLDGLIVGFVGNFLFQMLGPYGVSVTTVLWALPDAARGLLAGLYAARVGYSFRQGRLIAALAVISVITTTLTTGVMYLDCLIFKYSFIAYSPFILVRYVTGIAVAVVMALILPPLLRVIKNSVLRGRAR